MDPRQRKRIEHGEDLGSDPFRSVGVARGRNIGLAAPQKIGTIDAAAVGDRRNPAVPEFALRAKPCIISTGVGASHGHK